MPERHGCPDPTLARSGDLALILAVPRQRKQDIDDLPKARRLSAGKEGNSREAANRFASPKLLEPIIAPSGKMAKVKRDRPCALSRGGLHFGANLFSWRSIGTSRFRGALFIARISATYGEPEK